MTVAIGRPKGGSDARIRLIEAALALFSSRSFQTVSTRELAREANVDASLIRYYFGSKSGLFEQMVRETLAPVLARFQTLSADHEPDDLHDLIQIYYRAMGPNPGLPRLILRVLQDSEGTEPYRIILSVFSEIIRVSGQWFGNTFAAKGKLHKDMDPNLARLSLVSLMVFPLVAPPVLIQQFGLATDAKGLQTLARHNVDVIQRGILRADSRSQK